jgi:hypothetical protein
MSELIYALARITEKASDHINGSGRQKINNTLIEYRFGYYGDVDYRVESINGKMCYIFKSKINGK